MQFLQTQGRQGSIPRVFVSFVDRFETNLCPYELYAVFL